MQRTLAAATAVSALPLGLEIYFEHFKGSFGDKWMWTPVASVAGADRRRRRRSLLRARGPDLASRSIGALLPGRHDRRGHSRPRRRAQARRLRRAAVQHRDGTAAAGAGLARAGRRPRRWRRAPRAGASAAICRSARDAARRESSAPAPGHAADARPLSGLQRARPGRPLGRGHAATAARPHESVPPLRFFTAREALTLGVFCDLVLAQDSEPKVPVLEHGRREAVRGRARRLSLRGHAR